MRPCGLRPDGTTASRLASLRAVTPTVSGRSHPGRVRRGLARPRFGLHEDAVAALIDYLDFARETVAAEPLPARLPEQDDEPFVEVALARGADCLVIGNPANACAGMMVPSPLKFVQRDRSRIASGDA